MDIFKNHKQSGISLTEAILGVATLGVGLGIIADLQVKNIAQVQAETAAQQMQIVRDAANAYVRDKYSDIVLGDDPDELENTGCQAATCGADLANDLQGATDWVEIPNNALINEDYIDPRLIAPTAPPSIRLNPFGQSYRISVRAIAPVPGSNAPQLRVQVVTQGGDVIEPRIAAQIASAIGNEGGFRPEDDSTPLYANDVVQGAYGAWEMDAAEMGDVDNLPGEGGLASVAFFGEGGVTADFLYRNPVPGQPDAQQMNANINANDFGIGNVRQIGGGNGGGAIAPTGNPDMADTGVAPDPITANMRPYDVADTGPDRIDSFAGGAERDVVRFGNTVNSRNVNGVATTAYNRGNVSIQAHDAIVSSIDAEYRVRSLERLEAINRETPNGRRAIVDSGLADDPGNPGLNVLDAVAVAPAAAGVLVDVADSTDPGFKAYDDDGDERALLTFDGDNDGQVVIGSDTTFVDNRRGEMNYGLNDVNVADATAGNIVLRDEGAIERYRHAYQSTQGFTFFNDEGGNTRYRQEYGTDLDNAAGLDPVVGRMTMADNTNTPRFQQDYGVVSAAAAANASVGRSLVFDNNAVAPRYRQDYGLNEAGTAVAAGGNVVANDETNVMRYEMRYAAADTGRLTIRDRALQDPDEERFVASYNGNNGAVIARSAGAAAGTAAVRYQQSYNGPNQGQIAIRSRGQQAADQERFVAAYDDANNGRVMIRDEAANNRFADEYAGAASATTISDNVNRVRFRNEVTNANNSFSVIRDTGGVDRIEHRIAGDNTRSFMVNTAGGNAQAIIQDAGGNNRIVSFVDAGDTRFEIREPDNDLRYRYQSSTGILETRDAGNDRRFTVTAQGNTASTELAMWNEGGGQERVRLFSGNNGGSSELRLIDNNATEKVRILGGGNGNQAQIQMDGPNGNQRALLVTGVNNTPSQFQLRNPNGTDVGVVMRGNAGGTESLFDPRDNSNNVKTRMLGGNANNDRSLLQMSDGGNVKFQVNTRGNGNSTGVKIGNNGGTGTFGGSPLGPASSVLDVDDIFLRGRNTWLSNALQVHVIGSQVVRVGNSFNNGAAATCPGGNRLYVATPAWWLSPTMIGVTDITTTDGGRVSSFGTINPATGALLSGGAYDNNTEVQVFMSAGGNLNMRARQKNDAGWRTINNGVAVVTAYCEPS
ncbi:MAG TPA: hypothetical protein DFI00_02360 [Rhodospirillaceae bacterium]|nr:hypothetical protein [Rhodospirillaceae bacterium]